MSDPDLEYEALKAQMLRSDTPVEDHRKDFGLWVKREDLSCLAPGPAFSKTRGVFAHIASLDAQLIGVLDTYHSQAGHAVAMACKILGRGCLNYYPEYKYEPGHRAPQDRAKELGADLFGLPAGRSAVLYHQAKKHLASFYRKHPDGSGRMIPFNSYMMPNALKLVETVTETAKEVALLPSDLLPNRVVIPSSSTTIAAGVIRGFLDRCGADYPLPTFLVHMGYSRSEDAIMKYLAKKVGDGFERAKIVIIDEGYGYKDKARPGITPPWPCNEYYDLKALRWWVSTREVRCMVDGPETLFWNIG